MKLALVSWLIVAGTAALAGCAADDPERPGPAAVKARSEPYDTTKVVARVDGEPILSEEIREIVEEKKGEIDENQALRALIDRELLAGEARRRGWANSSIVQDARRNALARVVLRERIDEGIDFSTLDKEKLRRYYELNKERFVHGLQRRVIHILARTGKKGLSDDLARQIASDAAKRAAHIKTKEAFVQFGESFVAAHNAIEEREGKVIIEPIPPFSADSEKYARPFVEAAFAVPAVGQVSKEIKTEFGWHVIFVEEEIPPINRPYEEVAEELGKEVLPQEKKLKSSQLIDELYKNGDVFLYENALQTLIEPQ